MNEWVICKNCGFRRGLHGGADNPARPYPCPANEKEPKYPWDIEKKDGEERAQQVFQARLDAYWAARTTSFEADDWDWRDPPRFKY